MICAVGALIAVALVTSAATPDARSTQELLAPVHGAVAGRVRGDANLAELGAKNVGAMSRRVHPRPDCLLGGLLSGGDVLHRRAVLRSERERLIQAVCRRAERTRCPSTDSGGRPCRWRSAFVFCTMCSSTGLSSTMPCLLSNCWVGGVQQQCDHQQFAVHAGSSLE